MPEVETLFSPEYWNNIDVTSDRAMELSAPYHIDLGTDIRRQSSETKKTLKRCGEIFGIVPVYGLKIETSGFIERKVNANEETTIDLTFSPLGSLFALRLESITHMPDVNTEPGRIKGETPLHPSASLVDIWRSNEDIASPTSIDGDSSLFYTTSLHWGLMIPKVYSGATNDALLTIPFHEMPRMVDTLKEEMKERATTIEELEAYEKVDIGQLAPLVFGKEWFIRACSVYANRVVLPTSQENVQVEESRHHRTLRRVRDIRSVEILDLNIKRGGPQGKRRNKLKNKSLERVSGLIPGLVPNPNAI